MAADALGRLRDLAAALESVAEATASADPVRLDACEAPLEHAISNLPPASQFSPHDAADVRQLTQRIESALNRCRAVGAAITELVAVSLAAQGVAPGYKPAGAGAPAPRMGRMGVRV